MIALRIMPSIIVILVSILYSYKLFHVNNFKLLILYFGVITLSLFNLNKKTKDITFLALITLVPYLFTLPGIINYPFITKYFFTFEILSHYIPYFWFLSLCLFFDDKSSSYTQLSFGVVVILSLLFFSNIDLEKRLYSTMGNANYYASFLALTLPLFIFNIFSSIKKERIIYIIFSCAALLALYYTKSRVALVSFLISTFFCLCFYLKDKDKKYLIIFILSFFSLGLIFLLTNNRFENLLTIQTWDPRRIPWLVALKSIKKSIMFGHGAGQSYFLYFQNMIVDSQLFTNDSSFRHAHSEYLEMFQEGGLLYFLVNLIFWFFIFKTIIKKIKEKDIQALMLLNTLLIYSLICFFSVAPRMIVTKIPLYTIMAMFFYKNLDFPKLNFTIPTKKIITFSNIILVFPLYYILHSSYITKELHTSPLNTKTFDDFSKNIQEDNPYFMQKLIALQLNFKKDSDIKKNLDLFSGKMPNYRDQNIFYAQYYLLKRNSDMALKYSTIYKSTQNKYDMTNARIIMHIAKIKNNFELFMQEFFGQVQLLIYKNNLQSNRNPSHIVLYRTEGDKSALMKYEGQNIQFIVNEKRWKDQFEISRQSAMSFNEVESNIFKSSLDEIIKDLTQSSFFKPDVNEDSKDLFQKYLRQYSEYQNMYNKVKQEQHWKILNSVKKEFPKWNVERSSARKLNEKVREISDKHKPTSQETLYLEKIAEAEKILESLSNWNKIKRKQEFVNMLHRVISEVLLPI